MTSITIELPDELAETLARRAEAAGLSGPGAYAAAMLAGALHGGVVTTRSELEARLLEALDSGPSGPLTREDLEAIRREGQAILAARRGAAS